MQQIRSLQNYFLVATPKLTGSFWQNAVVYLCDHSLGEGSMGIMVSHPLQDVTFDAITQELDISPTNHSQKPPILTGGPVEKNRGFILHDDGYTHESTLDLAPHVHLTATSDIVSKIANGTAPKNLNFCLGYAGWSPGQLEEEIADNSWLMMQAEPHILYKTPAKERHKACLAHLRVDPTRMAPTQGHA